MLSSHSERQLEFIRGPGGWRVGLQITLHCKPTGLCNDLPKIKLQIQKYKKYKDTKIQRYKDTKIQQNTMSWEWNGRTPILLAYRPCIANGGWEIHKYNAIRWRRCYIGGPQGRSRVGMGHCSARGWASKHQSKFYLTRYHIAAARHTCTLAKASRLKFNSCTSCRVDCDVSDDCDVPTARRASLHSRNKTVDFFCVFGMFIEQKSDEWYFGCSLCLRFLRRD